MGRVNADGVHYRSKDRQKFLNKIKKTINKEEKHALKRKPWTGVTCSVCLEVPHNSVILLCASHHKGCRPYMCATGSNFSNCLKQYKKAYAKNEKSDKPQELLCPLCRGQVKGCTVVKEERKYLNSRKRACMEDNCSFLGSYRQLKKHVKVVHPRAEPRAVDPVLEDKWKKLEVERERSDVISTVMSSIPDAMVVGDYVIERERSDVVSTVMSSIPGAMVVGDYVIEPDNNAYDDDSMVVGDYVIEPYNNAYDDDSKGYSIWDRL